jgi:hypothetical protein
MPSFYPTAISNGKSKSNSGLSGGLSDSGSLAAVIIVPVFVIGVVVMVYVKWYIPKNKKMKINTVYAEA